MTQWDGILSTKSGGSSGVHLRTPNIPGYQRINRSSRPGPVTGGYMVLTSGPSFYQTAGIVQAAWAVPFDAKILAYGVRRLSSTPSVLDLALYSSTDGSTLSIVHMVDYIAGVSTTTPAGFDKTAEFTVNRGEDLTPDNKGIYGLDLPAADHVDNRLNNSNASAIHIGSTHPWIIIANLGAGSTLTDAVHYVVLVPTSHVNANPSLD